MVLPQANRLRHWRDFQAVYQRGNRRSGRYFTLRVLRQLPRTPNLPLQVTESERSSSAIASQGKAGEKIALSPDPRKSLPRHRQKQPSLIGISISQKVSKKAVVRNRIKRQIRAALRQLLPRLSAGWQLVLVVRPTAVGCDYAQFLQELEQLLVEAEVLNGH
ncbi:MAG TPA: ribonuclease P protein component [Cyanobacteria bacterium UBA8803]|nr:ribonuclease P protein component [Cyanobacteria bacterium UBA9273]HBL57137.1 ribonuclease P protein component [Cyanobacteria bacterium UBA8803]